MKKLFISQPMADKTNEQILAVREQAVAEAEKKLGEPVKIIDSFFADAPHDAKPLWFLGKAFEKLSTADIAFFACGWDEYRGCRLEYEAAKAYGIEMIVERRE